MEGLLSTGPTLSIFLSTIQGWKKTYERASNAHVNFFLAHVKSVPNFTLFCRKNELCCDFAFCRVIHSMAFKLVNC